MATLRDRWRFVPLLAAVAVYTAAVLSFGWGFLLVPVGLALNAIAFRRKAPPRGFIFWIGTFAMAAVAVVGLYILALFIAALA